MIAFIILLGIAVTFLLNLFFVRKIAYKTYKICMGVLNLNLSLVFVILFICNGIIKNHLNSFIDSGIEELEFRVNEVYPGALEKPMSTEEIKNLLEESLNKKEVKGIESLAENVIKAKIKKYTSFAIKSINLLERENNKLSVKDALISIKELSINAVYPYFRIFNIILFILYFLMIVVSIIITIHLSKDKDLSTGGIIFGENAL